MLKEILILGRGGQGTVTSATLLVDAASRDGLEAQGFPFFGAERRGAPVSAFVRVSNRPVRRHGMFRTADVAVVLDTQLVRSGVLSNYSLRGEAVLIVNSPPSSPLVGEIARRLGARVVYTVDATKISRDLGLVVAGWPVVNTGVLGSVSRATGFVSLESVVGAIKDYFGGRLGELNARAAMASYVETRKMGVEVLALGHRS